MPRNLLYFLMFSNACVLSLCGLRWLSTYNSAIAQLSAMDKSTLSLLWDSMPKAVLFFLLALLYLLAELVSTIRTANHVDILDIPTSNSNADR
ncbi:MAG: hypothetical protein ACI84C_002819 [Flavobacteriales bacterium]|jgi:hypothetical protein